MRQNAMIHLNSINNIIIIIELMSPWYNKAWSWLDYTCCYIWEFEAIFCTSNVHKFMSCTYKISTLHVEGLVLLIDRRAMMLRGKLIKHVTASMALSFKPLHWRTIRMKYIYDLSQSYMYVMVLHSTKHHFRMLFYTEALTIVHNCKSQFGCHHLTMLL